MTARRQVDERREAACPIIRAPDWTARISPACAGNTSNRRPSGRVSADQPRVRGEHRTSRSRHPGMAGSAPRARGTRPWSCRGGRAPRISPACAGNTDASADGTGGPADQPRVRGEHSVQTKIFPLLPGSAPRARGTLRRTAWATRRTRISPACAGNTTALPLRSKAGPDQPRVRGEHVTCIARINAGDGSAPRARGTHCCGQLRE